MKTTTKSKKNPNLAVNSDETAFVCNVRILTELCVNGMNDLATKVRHISHEYQFLESYVQVADYSRLILLHLLQSKLLVAVEFWHHLMNTIATVLPQLQVRRESLQSIQIVSFSVMQIKSIHWVNVF